MESYQEAPVIQLSVLHVHRFYQSWPRSFTVCFSPPAGPPPSLCPSCVSWYSALFYYRHNILMACASETASGFFFCICSICPGMLRGHSEKVLCLSRCPYRTTLQLRSGRAELCSSVTDVSAGLRPSRSDVPCLCFLNCCREAHFRRVFLCVCRVSFRF